jgi:hypothetical protein
MGKTKNIKKTDKKNGKSYKYVKTLICLSNWTVLIQFLSTKFQTFFSQTEIILKRKKRYKEGGGTKAKTLTRHQQM